MPSVLTQTQAATIFGVSVSAIRHWREEGWLDLQGDPPRATLEAYSQAAATARWAPQRRPTERDVERCLYWNYSNPPAEERGVQSFVQAVLACAMADPKPPEEA